MKLWIPVMCVMSFISVSAAQQLPNLVITPLVGEYYVYTTYNHFNGSLFPSNSMYMITNEGAVLIDTPWDSSQYQPLLDSIEARHGAKVVLCISTHFHDDRTAGIDYFRSKGIPTYTSERTRKLCEDKNENVPEFYFVSDTVFKLGGKEIQTFFPGEGHSKDNIVVWFPDQRILFGGCLVKSTENSSLGNIADANLPAWGGTIEKVIERYPKPKFVVPGHFSWNGKPLQHTLKLLKAIKKK